VGVRDKIEVCFMVPTGNVWLLCLLIASVNGFWLGRFWLEVYVL
jgi:hypothetical protein